MSEDRRQEEMSRLILPYLICILLLRKHNSLISTRNYSTLLSANGKKGMKTKGNSTAKASAGSNGTENGSSSSNALQDQMELVLQMMDQRARGTVDNHTVEQAVSDIIEKNMGGGHSPSGGDTFEKTPAKTRARRRQSTQQQKQQEEVTPDMDNYDDDDNDDENDNNNNDNKNHAHQDTAPPLRKSRTNSQSIARNKSREAQLQNIPMGTVGSKMMSAFGKIQLILGNLVR